MEKKEGMLMIYIPYVDGILESNKNAALITLLAVKGHKS